MASTLVERESDVGRRIGWLSVLVNLQWLDLPLRRISGRYDVHPLAVR